MYTDKELAKQQNGIYKYNYRNIDYKALERVIKSGASFKMYVDASVLLAIVQKGLEDKIEVVDRGSHYTLIKVNPEYIVNTCRENVPMFPIRRKMDIFGLIENVPEGVDEDKWIDACMVSTDDGEKDNTLYKTYLEYSKELVEVEDTATIIDGEVYTKSDLVDLPEHSEYRKTLTGVLKTVSKSYDGNTVQVSIAGRKPYKIQSKFLSQNVYVKI